MHHGETPKMHGASRVDLTSLDLGSLKKGNGSNLSGLEAWQDIVQAVKKSSGKPGEEPLGHSKYLRKICAANPGQDPEKRLLDAAEIDLVAREKTEDINLLGDFPKDVESILESLKPFQERYAFYDEKLRQIRDLLEIIKKVCEMLHDEFEEIFLVAHNNGTLGELFRQLGTKNEETSQDQGYHNGISFIDMTNEYCPQVKLSQETHLAYYLRRSMHHIVREEWRAKNLQEPVQEKVDSILLSSPSSFFRELWKRVKFTPPTWNPPL